MKWNKRRGQNIYINEQSITSDTIFIEVVMNCHTKYLTTEVTLPRLGRSFRQTMLPVPATLPLCFFFVSGFDSQGLPVIDGGQL